MGSEMCIRDRPGIMLASAARRYVNQYAVKPVKKPSFSQIMMMDIKQPSILQDLG